MQFVVMELMRDGHRSHDGVSYSLAVLRRVVLSSISTCFRFPWIKSYSNPGIFVAVPPLTSHPRIYIRLQVHKNSISRGMI